MSDHDEDELAISDPHPLFPHTYHSNGRDTSHFQGPSTATTSSLKVTGRYHKRHGSVSPVSNRGVGNLLRTLNASFVRPSSSHTQSLSSSFDELPLPQVDPYLRRATLDHYDHSQTCGARESTGAVASTSSIPLGELRAPSPSKQYPRSTLISPRRTHAAASLGIRRSNRFDDEQTTAYHADLDEIEAWNSASVSSVVFKRPVYKKNPSVERIRSATRSNLKSLTRKIGAQSGDKDTSSVQRNDLQSLGGPSTIAVPEMNRTARCNLIISEILAPDQRIDEGTSTHISSQSSSELDTTAEDVIQRSPELLGHNSHSLFENLTPKPSRTSLPFSGHALESKPEKHLPLNGFSIPPSVQIPPLEDAREWRSRSSGQTSELKEDSVPGLTFAIDPHSALHRQPASLAVEKDSRQPPGLDISGFESSIPPFQEPSPEADYYASVPLPTSSDPLIHSPRTFTLFEEILPEHLEAPQEAPSLAPLSTFEPEVDGMSTHSITDNQRPINPVQATSEELIEIVSPMVLEEQYNMLFPVFDPILASSLSSKSGAYFTSTQGGASTLQPSLQATAATTLGAQNEDIDIDENEFINFDPPAMDSAENLQPDSIFSTSPVSVPSPSESRSSAPPPAPVPISDVSLSQSPHEIPPSINGNPSLRTIEAKLPARVPMARANWVDVDLFPPEETQDTYAGYRKGSAPTVLDPRYLQPRYRDLWAPDGDNPYLQRAKSEMVIGKVRTNLEIWYVDGRTNTQDVPDEEELDELEEDDVESEDEDEDVEMEDAETGVVFLSQASKVQATPTTPTRKRPLKSNISLSRILTTSSGNPESPPIESLSTRRSNNLPSSRSIPPDAHKNKRGRKRKRQESLEGSDKMRDGLGDRVVRWESVLKTFIKGKKSLEQQDLLELKQALQDIRVSAAYISPTSSLVEYVGLLADMELEDIPMGDAVGLRALAKELVQTWT